MRQIFSTKFTLLVFLGLAVTMALWSCEREDLRPSDQPDITASVATTYGVYPTVGGATTPSSTVATLSGSCGTFTSNDVSARVTSQSGNTFTIRIAKVAGGNFIANGTAYLKMGSVCGTILASATYNTSMSSISLNYTPTFSTGIEHVYPVLISSTGSRLFAEPVLLYSLPSYISTTTFGVQQGTVDNVPVYYNGSTSPTTYNYWNGTNTGYKWQCVEFCNRYYLMNYGMNIRGTTAGNAYQYYGLASQKGLLSYPNGGSVAPRVGDVLCFSGGTGGFGHISIVTEVSSNQVKVAQQNAGSAAPIGYAFTRSGNTVTPWSGYSCQGWLRKP